MTKRSTSNPDSDPSRKGSLATLKGLLPFLRPYRRQFVLAGIALLFAAGATLAIPAAFKQMIDLGFAPAIAGSAGSRSEAASASANLLVVISIFPLRLSLEFRYGAIMG